MKTFDEVYKEISSNVSVTKSGKPKKTFSKTDFDSLAKALINTPEHKAVYYGTKGGEVTTKDVYPVKQFRESLKKVLTDNGIDAQEAAKFVTDYEFTNVDGMYEFVSEILYQYMDAGKKFDFPTREDFKASMSIKTIEESEGIYSAIPKKGDKNPPAEFKIKTKKHKVLEKKSKAPDWLKKKFAK